MILLFNQWLEAYRSARGSCASDDTLADAPGHFGRADAIEQQLISASASPATAAACLAIAIRLMSDEADTPDEEPSYAGLLRAALRHLAELYPEAAAIHQDAEAETPELTPS